MNMFETVCVYEMCTLCIHIKIIFSLRERERRLYQMIDINFKCALVVEISVSSSGVTNIKSISYKTSNKIFIKS